jgi:hypothetical protein
MHLNLDPLLAGKGAAFLALRERTEVRANPKNVIPNERQRMRNLGRHCRDSIVYNHSTEKDDEYASPLTLSSRRGSCLPRPNGERTEVRANPKNVIPNERQRMRNLGRRCK